MSKVISHSPSNAIGVLYRSSFLKHLILVSNAFVNGGSTALTLIFSTGIEPKILLINGIDIRLKKLYFSNDSLYNI